MATTSSVIAAPVSPRIHVPRIGVSLIAAMLLTLLVAIAPFARVVAQTGSGAGTNVALPASAAKVPFLVGEKLEYEVRFGSLKVGNGTMSVQGVDDVRGRPSWHAVFAYSGSMLGFRVNDRHETWFDVDNFSSRRFHQDIDNPGYDRTRRYEIFPERGMFREGTKAEEPTPQNPLDEASFLYFVRTLPLDAGKTYIFSRYFKAQGNPIRIRVLRRERVKVPAGEFNAVVIQPTFQTKGLFSEGGKAEVWVSDDASRVVLQIKSKLSIGSINLYLKSQSRTASR